MSMIRDYSIEIISLLRKPQLVKQHIKAINYSSNFAT